MNESSHTHEPPRNRAATRYGLRSLAPLDARRPPDSATLADLLGRLDQLGACLADELRHILDRYDAGHLTRMQLVDELDARIWRYPRDRKAVLSHAVGVTLPPVD